MRGNELLDKMELIDPIYIEAADTAPSKRKSIWAKWGRHCTVWPRLSEANWISSPSEAASAEVS